MIGEGHKGTSGLGDDKSSVKMLGRIWHARLASSTGQMGGTEREVPTRFRALADPRRLLRCRGNRRPPAVPPALRALSPFNPSE